MTSDITEEIAKKFIVTNLPTTRNPLERSQTQTVIIQLARSHLLALSSYHPNTNCRWKIEPEEWVEGDSIALSFQRIDTEESFDLISVYDGDTLIGQFSGVDIPNHVVATSGISY